MIQGVPESDAYVVHENRRDAIRFAVNQAEAGDVILIAGKGHEDYQVVGDEVIDFDDRVEARIAIEKTRTRIKYEVKCFDKQIGENLLCLYTC